MNWDIFGNFVDGISLLCMAIGLISSIAQWLRKRPPMPILSIYIGATCLFIGLLAGNYLGQHIGKWQANQRSITISNFVNSTSAAQVDIHNAKFLFPASLELSGTFSGTPKNEAIWVYVLANDNKYYLYKTVMRSAEKIWKTSGPVAVGDSAKVDREYEVGILLGKAGECLELNTNGLTELPVCATKITTVALTRN